MISSILIDDMISSYEENQIRDETIQLFNENRQDILDEMILEQVRRDQWNKQFSFLISSLGYEVVPEKDVQHSINEGALTGTADIILDLLIGFAPDVIRGLGLVLAPLTIGGSTVSFELIAKLFAGGGVVYYLYFAQQSFKEGEKLNGWVNFISALFSLYQVQFPLVSSVLGGLGRTFMRWIVNFFSLILGPTKAIFGIAGKATSFTAQKLNEKLGGELFKIAKEWGKGPTGLKTKGMEALAKISEMAAGPLQKALDAMKAVLDIEVVKNSLNPDALVKFQVLVEKDLPRLIKECTDFSTDLAKGLKSLDDAVKAGDDFAKRNEEILEFYKFTGNHMGAGKVLNAFPDIGGAQAIAKLEAQAVEGAGALGKAAGELLEKTFDEGLKALDNVAASAANKTRLVSELNTSLANKLANSTLPSEFIPEFVISGDDILIRFADDLADPAGGIALTSGTAVTMQEGLSLLLKQEQKLLGVADGKQVQQIYSLIIDGVKEAPVYQDMAEQLAKLSGEVAEATGNTGMSGKIYEWFAENTWRAFISDFGGLTASFVRFRNGYSTASGNVLKKVAKGIYNASPTAAVRETLESAGKLTVDVGSVPGSFKIMDKTLENFWLAFAQFCGFTGTKGTIGRTAAAAFTADSKAFDPRSASQIRAAQRKASRPTPVKSTIKTRADGTAGTIPKSKGSSSGATKTKITADDLL